VGGIYYAANNYDMTIRFFTDAVNLKPDYVNAYYNLAVALRDKGDLQNAKLIADQAVTLLQKDPTTPDYKVATALAEDLKSKVAAKAKTQPVPAAQTNSALGNPKLPDVNVPGLNNLPEVATPEAVKKNPEAVVPVTPTPVSP
jgi:tetratricopeptide (TPR) repeat protein